MKYDYDNAPTDPRHGGKLTAEMAAERIKELEGDLSVARLQLQRIDEELVGSYGEIATMPVKGLRRILSNIAYIVRPTR